MISERFKYDEKETTGLNSVQTLTRDIKYLQK